MLSADDQLLIMDLSARYCHATDTHDPERWADTFTADGTIESPQGAFSGRDALIEFSKGVHASMPTARHHISNIVICGEGDTATMKSYLNLINAADNSTAFTATYEDELAKIDGEWFFTLRKIVT